MLSIFTRNTSFVASSPRTRDGEHKGALSTWLLCSILLALSVASAQAQGPPPPPGAWSNPVTTITGSHSTEHVTTNDGATYGPATYTESVNRTDNSYNYSVMGGYYTQPGFDFYYGSNTIDLTATVTYIYTLALGEVYQPSATYYSIVACDAWADENCASYQPQAANNGLGDAGVLTTSGSYFATDSQGTHQLEGKSSFNSSNNTVTVIYTISANAGSANHDSMNWNAVVGMNVLSRQPTF